MKKVITKIDRKVGKEIFFIVFLSVIVGLAGAFVVQTYFPQAAVYLLWFFLPCGLIVIFSILATFFFF